MSIIDLDEAARRLDDGLVIGLPTDTVYGLAASIARPQALAALFALKHRPESVPLPILIDSAAGASSLGVRFDRRADRLATRFWPGPLTVIVPAPKALARLMRAKRKSVGVRVPNDETLLRLLRVTGALAVTSANYHGAPPCTTAAEVLAVFGGAEHFGGVVDDGPRDGAVSSVVDLSRWRHRIVRHGALSDDVLAAALSRD